MCPNFFSTLLRKQQIGQNIAELLLVYQCM